MNKPPPGAPAVIIRNAQLSYAQKLIFENLNYTIPAQQITCLLGPSGVGKSTLLHMIADIVDYNEVDIKATISTDTGISLKDNIAYMGQTDLLMPWLTVLNNGLLGYRVRGEITAELKQRAINLLNQVGLGEELNKLPSQLSGGMRQRVALVRTLMENKPIILMDEPFSALDAITRLDLQNLAATLLKDKTVLLVTHDPLEALRLGQNIVIMSGSPAQLHEIICPQSGIPRAANDENVLHLQGEILTQLEIAN